jgi:tetratricopeptide (TPR) repeat protein
MEYTLAMKAHPSLLPDDGPGLDRRDLITYEHLLRDEIAAFLPHKSYSLYFPRSLDDVADGPMAEVAAGRAAVVPGERRVLLPLALNGRLLGVFVAREAGVRAPKTTLPHLAAMARMCLEKILLYKISVTDSATGLASRDLLLRAMTRAIAQVGDSLHPGAPGAGTGPDTGAPGFAACFGLVAVRLHNLEHCQEAYGPALAAKALAEAARTLAAQAPEQALAARAGDDTLALCLPGATPAACRDLADRVARAMADILVADPVLDQRVHPAVSVGHAAYPQDMNGHALRTTAQEQAATLLRKALRAAAVAARTAGGRAVGYPQILDEGGQIQTAAALGRLTVDLGSAVGAREGQRFLVWPGDACGGQPAAPKAEIALLEVRRSHAVAEIMTQADPGSPPLPGDRLTRIHEAAPEPHDGPGPRRDALTGLLRYRDFLEHWAGARESLRTFTLALMRLPDDADPRHTETALNDLARAAAATFGPGAVGGRHSLGGLVWLLPATAAQQAAGLCEKLLARLAASGTPAPAIGLAQYPWLSFSRVDTLDNAAKALEYARLLPAPHLGRCDSLALTIHADKLFAQGRLYDAIEEYKLALLADRANTTARNSLGVALARTGDLAAAKRQFKTVLGRNPKDLFALYNYGYACQRTGKAPQAREAYRACLAVDKTHTFALIRLGELAQAGRRFADARRYFLRARNTPGGQGLTERYLARLALARNDTEQAREHLHQALIHDPMDALALHLMARLYLDAGEDPEVAEALARQSAALAPGQPRFWAELARALTAQGKHQEAAATLARAEQQGA